MQLPIFFRFLSHIFASKNQIPVVAITMPNGKIPSKDTRTDPIICSSTIINHILLGFKKDFSNISVPPYGMVLLLFFN